MILLRLLAGLLAAGVAAVAALVMAAALTALLPEQAGQAIGVFLMVLMPIVAFVWIFRRMEPERRRIRREIRIRQQQALDREIGPKAQSIAVALGQEGVYQSATLRITGGNTPRIEVPQDSGWATVFAARHYLPVAGDKVHWVERSPRHPRWFRIYSWTVGGRPATWTIESYVPGPWEDELDVLVKAAKAASFENEKDRFGL